MAILSGRPIAVRLAVSSLFWSSLVLVVAGLVLATLYRQSTERSFDERLLVYANDLAADLVTPPEGDKPRAGGLGDPRFEIPLSGWYWQVGRVEASSREMRSSRSLIGNPLPVLAQGGQQPFGEVRMQTVGGPEGRSLRLVERGIDLGEEGRFIVRVAGPADEIAAALNRFLVALVSTFLLVGIGLGVSTLLQIRFGLRPLSDLRHAVSDIRRGVADRISGHYPPDIAPVAQELNLLLDANQEILERARTQVGNLAHALKTPLSVIVNEADGPSDKLGPRVREQAAIMRHQVDYYLQRARTAALAGKLGVICDPWPVLEGLVRTFGKIVLDRVVAIELTGDRTARFRGERQDLEEMAGNLIDNACKWANSRVRVTVAAATADERPVFTIRVEDDGPGMPEEAREEALKRGRRLDETKPGSGLGLSIVTDLAAHYGGGLSLGTSEFGGALAELRLPGDTAA